MKSQEITFKVYSWATKTGIRRDCEWVGYIFKPPSNCITSVCCHATHLHTCLWKVFSLSFTSCGKSSSSSTYYWYQLVAFSIRHFLESCLKNRKLWSKNQLFWEKVTECEMCDEISFTQWFWFWISFPRSYFIFFGVLVLTFVAISETMVTQTPFFGP